MVEAGAFANVTGKVELVRGEIFNVNAVYLPHARAQGELVGILYSVFGRTSDYRVLGEISTRLSDDTVPQPDAAVVSKDLPRQGPLPLAALALAVEIAYSSLDRDLGAKLAEYARAGVPRVWVVDIGGRITHDCTAPLPDGYAGRRVVRFGEPLSLAPLADAELTIPAEGFD